MKEIFEPLAAAGPEMLERVARARPDDPFVTPAYCQAYSDFGLLPYLFRARAEVGEDGASCLGFLKEGHFTRSLQVRVTADIAPDSPFWNGLLEACNTLKVWDLEILSSQPRGYSVPRLHGELKRRTGVEYHLTLSPSVPMTPASKKHRANVAKARQGGLTIQRCATPDAIDAHVAAASASMERRRERGEQVGGTQEDAFYRTMLRDQAGEFFQAVREDRVVASIFLLRSKAGAYYQSGGSLPEGLDLGAATFLLVEAANVLRMEGVTHFSLGGVWPTEIGLRRFKERFGGTERPFEIISVSTVRPLLRKLRTFVRLALHNPAEIPGVLWAFNRSYAFSAHPGEVPAPPAIEGWTVRKLSAQDIELAAERNPEFTPQLERLTTLGFNDAFGAFVGSELANVSWLVTFDHDRNQYERDVKLRPGEAEITHCYTAANFRGRGVYPYMIQTLCQHATGLGVHRVYMIALSTNIASHRGIQKAGLKRSGEIVRIAIPFISGERLRLRLHRLANLFVIR